MIGNTAARRYKAEYIAQTSTGEVRDTTEVMAYDLFEAAMQVGMDIGVQLGIEPKDIKVTRVYAATPQPIESWLEKVAADLLAKPAAAPK